MKTDPTGACVVAGLRTSLEIERYSTLYLWNGHPFTSLLKLNAVSADKMQAMAVWAKPLPEA